MVRSYYWCNSTQITKIKTKIVGLGIGQGIIKLNYMY
jgi:hypothetical protein